jgi:hypothetical protein
MDEREHDMNQQARGEHKCHRCRPHDGPSADVAFDSIDATFAEDGGEIFFTSGYSAREIAQKRVREVGGQIYVNNVSRNVRRPNLTVPVSYAVSKGAVYTLRGPDEWHRGVYRAYWPPL